MTVLVYAFHFLTFESYSFIKTGQEDQIMGHTDLPLVVENVRKLCAMSSSLLGNVTAANNATRNASSATDPLVMATFSLVDTRCATLGLGLVLTVVGLVL